MSEIYQRFGKQSELTGFICDYSEEAAKEMFLRESQGKGTVKSDNGYALGKKWMDVTITLWKEDIREGLLTRIELEDEFPLWFLDKVLCGKPTE